MFKYKVTQRPFYQNDDARELERHMDNLGANGWRMVNVVLLGNVLTMFWEKAT
jgi:hypothetical protein